MSSLEDDFSDVVQKSASVHIFDYIPVPLEKSVCKAERKKCDSVGMNPKFFRISGNFAENLHRSNRKKHIPNAAKPDQFYGIGDVVASSRKRKTRRIDLLQKLSGKGNIACNLRCYLRKRNLGIIQKRMKAVDVFGKLRKDFDSVLEFFRYD